MQGQSITARVPRDILTIRYVSLVAGTVGAMFGELELARQTGMIPAMSWTYPVALDAYAYVSFRTGARRDVGCALGLMAASQALTHLVSSHILPMSWPIVVAVWAVILPLVIFRTHNVGAGHATPAATEWIGPGAEEVPAAPVELAAPKRARSTWRKDDALTFLRAHAHMSRDELAARMKLSPRRVNQLRAELAAC